MQHIKLSESTAAKRRIPLALVDDTAGDPATGLTFSASEIKISKNGGNQANSAGSVVEVVGGGALYYYEATALELDTFGFLTARVVKTGVAPFTALVQVIAPDPYDTVRYGLTALPNAAAGANGGLPTGNGSGQVAVASLATGAITAASIAADAIGASELAADAVSEIASGVRTELTTELGRVDVAVSTRLATGGYAAPPGSAAIADAVWDEALSGHAIGGSAGAALTGAGSAGDPWSATIPGSYGSGTAGKIVGDNLNATVSSRSTQTSVDTVAGYVDTEVATLVTQVAAILAAVDTEVAAIKSKTDLISGATLVSADIPTASANAAALLASTVESGASVLQGLRSLLGLVSAIDGAPGGPLHLKSFDGTKNRVTFSPDADGNRTVSSRDLT